MRMWLLMAGGCGVAAITIAAPAAAQARAFDIAAQPVDTALRVFGLQANVQIVAPRRLTAGKRTSPLKGSFAVADALDRMLKGTGLVARGVGSGAFTLVADAPAPDPQANSRATGANDPVAVPPPVSDQAPGSGGGEIVVTGIRSSLRSAQSIKRNSDQIVDSIVAEDIGKLPDNNASEAIARVTGVQVNRSNDEANGVLIRGLPNVETTLNGREIFTADGRAVAIQDFPAESLSAIDVFKTTTAENIEGGIAGLVNIRLRRPFDFDKLTVAGSIRGTYNDQSRKYDPIGSLLFSDRFDTGLGEFGVLLNADYSRAHYLNSTRFDGFLVKPGATQPIATPGIGHDFYLPQDVGIYYSRGERSRPSLNGSLQWRPSDRIEIHLDGLWQAFRGRSQDDFLDAPILAGNPTLTDVVLTSAGDNAQSLSTVSVAANGPSKNTNDTDTDTYQAALGGTYTGDDVKISTELAYTNSSVHSTTYNFDTALRTPPTLDVDFNVPAYGVEFSLPGTNLSDPNSYYFRGFYDYRGVTKGTQWQWRGDLDLKTSSSLFPHFQFGLRYTDRDASSRSGDRYAAFPQLRIPLEDVPGFAGAIIPAGFRGSDVQPLRNWFEPTRGYIREDVDQLRGFAQQGLAASGQDASAWAGALPAYNPVNNYAATERTYTAYTELRYAFDLGVPVDGDIGTRVVVTQNRLRGTTRNPDGTLSPTLGDEEYVDYLPDVSARVHFTDKLQLRLSRTEAVTRPGYNQINPALTLSQGTEGGTVTFTGSGGNPGLQPIRSNNYDASLEWYFARAGSVSVAGFYRKINGFINTLRDQEIVEGFGNIAVFRPVNGGSGTIKGIEAAFTTFFDFLPGALSGLGVQVNGTLIKGRQKLVTDLATGIATDNPLPGVSKYTYNLIGIYEKGPASLRVAYNYRSHFATDFTAGGLFNAEYTKAISRLDVSASLDLLKNLTITADATNLLRHPFEDYFGDPIYPRDVRYEARTFSVGARFRF